MPNKVISGFGLELLEGFVNLEIKNNATFPGNQLDITVNELSIGRKRVLSDIALTVDLATTGNNALDTGIESSATWYYVFVTYNPTQDVIGSLLSLSPTAPTLPSGFEEFRRIGAIRNSSASNFYQMRQYNDYCWYEMNDGGANNLITFGTATAFTALSCTALVPPPARLVNLHTELSLSNVAVDNVFSAYIRPTGSTLSTGIRACSIINQVTNIIIRDIAVAFIPLSSSQSFDYKLNAVPSVGGVVINVLGYYDPI